MKIDSNFLTSHKRGSFPSFSPRVIGAFFALPPFAFRQRRLKQPIPLPCHDQTHWPPETFKHFKQWRKQLNYANSRTLGSHLSFLRLGRTCSGAFLRLLARDSLVSVTRCCILVLVQRSNPLNTHYSKNPRFQS